MYLMVEERNIPSNNSTHHQQIGVSLIEILVSILILSIGLLGLAAIQNTSLRLAYESFNRTQASFIASDIMDRIRANPDSAPYSLSANSVISQKDCFAGDNCSSNNLRQFDLYYWQQNAQNLLPNASLELNYDATSKVYSMKLQWQDRQQNDVADDEKKEFIYHFQAEN